MPDNVFPPITRYPTADSRLGGKTEIIYRNPRLALIQTYHDVLCTLGCARLIRILVKSNYKLHSRHRSTSRLTSDDDFCDFLHALCDSVVGSADVESRVRPAQVVQHHPVWHCGQQHLQQREWLQRQRNTIKERCWCCELN